jgi:hypothetical protein
MVLNPSFNENEPVVCKAQEALDCFLRTKWTCWLWEILSFRDGTPPDPRSTIDADSAPDEQYGDYKD